MTFLTDIILAAIAVLSLLASALILFYLAKTERGAPRFRDSIKTIDVRALNNKLVSIIIPAKNEAETIKGCLGSLISQTHENIEVIVVDDSSTDETRVVVESLASKDKRIKLFGAGGKPVGWVGKSWPCWRGYKESTGDYLLFVDADSILEKSTIESSLEYVDQNKIDMLSLSPRAMIRGITAKAVLPLISGAINLLYPMQKVNDSKSERAYVFGTYILVRRSVYEATGGHEHVKSELVEDQAIAGTAKKSGFSLRIERGPEYVSTEWESEPRSVYHGMERIMSSSVRTYGLLSILNAVFLFFVALYPIIYVVSFIFLRPSDPTLLIGFIACVINISVFISLSTFELDTITGKMGASGLLYPLGSLFFMSAIVGASVKVTRKKELVWKDSRYVQTLKPNGQPSARQIS